MSARPWCKMESTAVCTLCVVDPLVDRVLVGSSGLYSEEEACRDFVENPLCSLVVVGLRTANREVEIAKEVKL